MALWEPEGGSRPVELAVLRQEYADRGLDPADLDPDPIAQVGRWLEAAVAAGVPEPNAMTLATVDAAGAPDARVVLLKGIDPRGFTFFTSYTSTKGEQLAARPSAALVLVWLDLGRQVRVVGPVERLPAEESDAYYASRPRESRLGAWASDQSAVLPGRAPLEERFAAVTARFAGSEPPRPEHWGGYLVRPERVELWQGRPRRLHDRLRYRRGDGAGWIVERLSP
ncbi:MAG: pyridoxamine 5'-phosphate oxidase [Acidimicrobiales bacterium]|nr:pyridoxamine 5'-phosphate oxidase [Acidimicrobiales bacterium]